MPPTTAPGIAGDVPTTPGHRAGADGQKKIAPRLLVVPLSTSNRLSSVNSAR
jgi:hypothetical protein